VSKSGGIIKNISHKKKNIYFFCAICRHFARRILDRTKSESYALYLKRNCKIMNDISDFLVFVNNIFTILNVNSINRIGIYIKHELVFEFNHDKSI
jgi:hypothetical protein